MYIKSRLNSPVRFTSGGQFISDEGPYRHRRRTIDTFEIIIGVRGTLYIRQDDTEYEIGAGDVLLLLPQHLHEGYRISSNLSYFWFHFLFQDDYSVVDGNHTSLDYSIIKTDRDSGALADYLILPIRFTLRSADKVTILFNQLLHLDKSEYFMNQGVNFLASLLLVELSQQAVENLTSEVEGDETTRDLSKILEWIRAHYRRFISVSDISEEFNYNKEYLSRLFKRKIGIGLQEYIHRQKIAKAKELLLSPESDSVQDIAYFLGFRDCKYFMRLFKRYEQMTPTQYRNAYHLTNMNNY